MGSSLRPARSLAAATLVATSFCLSVVGNGWGAPAAWHPDEVTARAVGMVRNRDLNPHSFYYGGLHYQLVAALAVAPAYGLRRMAGAAGLLDPGSGRHGDVTALTWAMVAARTLSALVTAAVVWITIGIGSLLFSPGAGIAAGLLLLFAPGTVLIGHYATVDPAANFWYWLACLGAVHVWKSGSRRVYLLSGMAAGLAIGTKVDRVLVLVPLVAAHLLRGKMGRHRDLAAALAMAPLAFVASNPAVVLSPFEFLDGFTRDLMFNAMRPRAALPLLDFARWVEWGLGTPLLALTATGAGLGTFLLLRYGRRRELAWLAATTLPIVALYSVAPSFDRYATLLFPGLSLVAGYAVARLLAVGPAWRRVVAGVPIAALLAWSLVACVAVDVVLLRDPRSEAAAWLASIAPAGSTVAMDDRGPSLSAARYRVSQLHADVETYQEDVRTRDRLGECAGCDRIRSAISALEDRVVAGPGRPDRTPYVADFDRRAGNVPSERAAQSGLPDADYVLLLPDRKPVTARRLAEPGSGYRRVVSFPAPRPFGMNPPFPFIGPPVEIYARSRP